MGCSSSRQVTVVEGHGQHTRDSGGHAGGKTDARLSVGMNSVFKASESVDAPLTPVVEDGTFAKDSREDASELPWHPSNRHDDDGERADIIQPRISMVSLCVETATPRQSIDSNNAFPWSNVPASENGTARDHLSLASSATLTSGTTLSSGALTSRSTLVSDGDNEPAPSSESLMQSNLPPLAAPLPPLQKAQEPHHQDPQQHHDTHSTAADSAEPPVFPGMLMRQNSAHHRRLIEGQTSAPLLAPLVTPAQRASSASGSRMPSQPLTQTGSFALPPLSTLPATTSNTGTAGGTQAGLTVVAGLAMDSGISLCETDSPIITAAFPPDLGMAEHESGIAIPGTPDPSEVSHVTGLHPTCRAPLICTGLQTSL